MSFTTATDTEPKNISVWFECKSCQLTFPFRTVAEFLDHKKQKHFAQFQKAQCIVFEERLQDELATNYSDQDSETKLFAQDDDVELCTGSRMGELVLEIADPSSLKTVPLPVQVPVSVPFPEPNQVQPPPLNLIVSHKDHSNTAIQTTNASALREKTRQEYELNADFGLFSVCLPSVYTSTVSDPCDLQADQILNDSTQTAVEAHHLACMLVDDENNSAIISPDRLSLDFSFVDDHDDKIDVPIEVDVPSNTGKTNNRNSTSPNPYVLLQRLSAKELLASHRSYNLMSALKSLKNLKFSNPKVDILHGPVVCTICSKSCKTKLVLGRHMNTHYEFNCGPRRFKCSYPDCPSSFDAKYLLKSHTKVHELGLNKPLFFKFPLPGSDTGLIEADPLTLREWLIQQKLTSEKSNNSSENSEAVNIIRLDPDPTEMDEATDKAFKISGKTPIRCELCRKNLESEIEVKVHVMHCWLRNKKRHCYCAPCDKSLSCHRALKTHTKRIHAKGINITGKHDPPPLLPPKLERKCHICLRPFTKLYTLNRHLVTHKNKEERERAASFVCEICGKAYIHKSELVRHIVAHGEDKPFKCSYPNCTATFKFRVALQAHLNTHLPKPENVPKLISCPKEGCSKRFTTRRMLRYHLKTIRHTGVPVPKSWKCDQENCEKMYRLKESLDRHRIAAHGVGGELPTFPCQICIKTFTWKLSLIAHLQSHSEERPYKCSYDGCEKSYKQIRTLNAHIRVEHTGERPFQCELCGKAYHRTMGLKWHMGVHRKSQVQNRN